MKKILLLTIVTFALMGCTYNSSNMKRYEIDLTLDNYEYYFDITRGGASNSDGSIAMYTFKGCLSYALYDNVILELYCTSKMDSTDYHVEEYKLNAAGNGSFTRYNLTFQDVRGKVIYVI